jgi:hypothetical protein
MKPVPTDLKLNLNARSELTLRSGDSLLVTVIKRLTGGRWAVGIRGRVLPASSEVELTPGQRLKAVVDIQGNRIILKIAGEAADPIRELVQRQGLQPGEAVESLVTAFLRSGLSITPDRLLHARQLLERFRLDPKKFARLIAILLSKGINPRSPGLEHLLHVLVYGEEDQGRDRGRGRRHSPDPEQLARQLQKDVEPAQDGEASSLQVFNHLRGSDQTWVVIPISYSFEGGGTVVGTVRLRFNTSTQRTDRLVVAARSSGGGKWSFLLNPQTSEMHVFGDSPDKPAKAELDVLLLKLQNLGVKTDDTIREEQNFDGFDLPWEELSYRNIDTVH